MPCIRRSASSSVAWTVRGEPPPSRTTSCACHPSKKVPRYARSSRTLPSPGSRVAARRAVVLHPLDDRGARHGILELQAPDAPSSLPLRPRAARRVRRLLPAGRAEGRTVSRAARPPVSRAPTGSARNEGASSSTRPFLAPEAERPRGRDGRGRRASRSAPRSSPAAGPRGAGASAPSSLPRRASGAPARPPRRSRGASTAERERLPPRRGSPSRRCPGPLPA